MKSLSKPLLALLLCLTSAASFSQSTKAKIFSAFPEVINCSEAEFSNAFTAREGQIITLSFSNNFTITGKVITNVQKYANLQSIILKVPEYANAVFHLSKQINEDRTVSYVGRLLSTEAGDGYEIKKAGNDYTFHKIEEEKIRQLCSQ